MLSIYLSIYLKTNGNLIYHSMPATRNGLRNVRGWPRGCLVKASRSVNFVPPWSPWSKHVHTFTLDSVCNIMYLDEYICNILYLHMHDHVKDVRWHTQWTKLWTSCYIKFFMKAICLLFFFIFRYQRRTAESCAGFRMSLAYFPTFRKCIRITTTGSWVWLIWTYLGEVILVIR